MFGEAGQLATVLGDIGTGLVVLCVCVLLSGRNIRLGGLKAGVPSWYIVLFGHSHTHRQDPRTESSSRQQMTPYTRGARLLP